MASSNIPGSVERAIAQADRGILPDNWTFQQLLREHLETSHPDPLAQGRTRAEVLVQAIVSGATKQAANGLARADLVKILLEEVAKETGGNKNGLSGSSLTDVQFLIVDPVGDDKVIDTHKVEHEREEGGTTKKV